MRNIADTPVSNYVSLARCYKTKSSLNAFDFLMRLNFLVNGQIAAILSDNGGEWAKYFEAACKKLQITHIFSRLRTPQDNSINKKFNRTPKEEFIQIDEWFDADLAETDLTQANNRLTDWLVFYNFTWFYQTLKYQAPIDYAYYQ